MSEQAEAQNPTVKEETEPESFPPPSPDASGAEAVGGGPAPTAVAESEAPTPIGAAVLPRDEPVPAVAASAETVETPAESLSEPDREASPEAAATPAEAATPVPVQAVVAPLEPVPEPATAAVETNSAAAEAVAPETASGETTAAETATSAAPATKTAEEPEEKAEVKEEPRPLTEEELARQAEVEALRLARDDHTAVEGRVIGWNQGGFHVVIGTLTTFCPRSEMELKNPKSPSFYLDKEFQFHVIKHQKRGKRIVVSRKQFLEQERTRILEEMKDRLVPGSDLEGRVSSITDFGAFVDLGGGIEGLVHITELSNRRVKHPRDRVEIGQDVQVRVLKVEQEGERISLSIKALEPNPYEDFARAHPRGTKFEGKVVRKTDFGIFVELLPGLDGMIHLSQLPLGTDLKDERLAVGTEVSGWVLRVEPKRERISLSMKEVPNQDPWKNVAERYPEGTVVEGQVEDVAPFGVFIQLEPGLTGLLPNSEMNLPRGQDRSKHYPPGKRVEIQVASIDLQRKRISLVPEGAQIEGSRNDYRDYMKQQKKQGEGMTAMAAAFAKLKEQRQDQA